MDEDFKTSVLAALDRLAPEETEADRKKKAEEQTRQAKAQALEARIKGIEKSTASARTNWFWYFGVLAFVSLTILGLDDGALFRDSSTAELPVIGYSVNLRSFLFFAPALITMVYIYLHGLIEQLWENVSRLPDRYEAPDGESIPIIEKLPVWLLLELALIKRDRLRQNDRGEGAVDRSGIGNVSVWAIGFLTWPATPLVLLWLWWRTLVMHDLWLSFWQIALIVFCVCFGWVSRNQMVTMMKRKPEE